jgi:hypothetical protein
MNGKSKALKEANKAFQVYEESIINNMIKDAVIVIMMVLIVSVLFI